MTKAEIVAQIAGKTGIEKVAVQASVEAFMEAVKGSLAAGENVYLRGFGSFIIKKRQKRPAVTLAKTRPSSSPSTIFLLSSRQRPL
jgi:DNA-binding protein HU-beta